MIRSSSLLILFAAVVLDLFSAPGIAQEKQAYPSRPVRFIVPFPPGGGTDIVGRMVAEKLGASLGQTFVVDNRPGAASTVGANIAAKAAADGHTVLMVTASYSIAASYYRNLPYDPINDFDPIGLVASQPLVLVANSSLPANSMKELIAHAKENPGKLNYASGGAGGINHLAGEMYKTMTGTNLVHIPYKGAGPALTGLLAGETQIMLATLGSALRHIKSGKLKALAVGSAQRSPLLPGVPTVAESGAPGFEAGNWYGMLVPHGTPKRIITLLNKHTGSVLRGEDIVRRLKTLAFVPVPSTPGQFGDYLRAEVAKWARAMKDAGVSPK